MREFPILFSAPMVRALLDGSKTQTRRIVKLPDAPNHLGEWQPGTISADAAQNSTGLNIPHQACIWHTRTGKSFLCPYGQPGDRLWVRETHAKIIGQSGDWIETDYRATYSHGDRLGDTLGIKKRWTPAIHMPRDACRIELEITAVRVERLQDMEGQAPYPGESDALAEGVHRIHHGDGAYYYSAFRDEPDGRNWNDPTDAFRELWESINGPDSWAANPWVWVVEFKRIAP